jgi:hypothetical protein
MAGKAALGGLVALAVAEVPQVMSAFLPSPTTAYQGGADPERVAWLRRGEVLGGAVAIAIAVGVTLIVRADYGASAWWVLFASLAVLVLFLLEYERAIRKGQAGGEGIKGAGY